ncbi:hypothetical protein BDM02DRAFT_3185038 [Thelephora ganbajun]|uniref:Uncharacterized protein n=1 Tax=Thelephora ganbajun TaxID=370292 RepID=A0ACB6ZMM5_THEGA|nr:hypothetical protein BDM02DRAFT_3185038 [Thelephora ganbajun]
MPAAIVGLAAQLPSGPNSARNLDYRTFWDFLSRKQQAFEHIPQERLEGLSGTIPNPVGSFLKDAQLFDNVEFGVSAKDAIAMTASSRRLIELSFLALLDSGINYRGRRVGSFAAGTNAEALAHDHIGYRNIGSKVNTLANRVAYTFDLTGPSLYLDTACSSTLTATHLAIRAIESGDCEAAVVSGCQYNMDMWDWLVYSDNGILTSDRCKPFDSGADGFVRSEGAVAIVIKPFEAALIDNDHIYAVVLGTAINNNGSNVAVLKPSGKLQQQCIRDAFLNAGRDPREVDYVELHATGTKIGDPVEANAAGEVFHRCDDLIIGSVKGNLGHLEAAAFFASLLKVCLIFEKGAIPPNANLRIPNPEIAWDKYRLKVPTESVPLSARSETGRSLISLASSGIGGSNGHAVLEEPPKPAYSKIRIKPNQPVVFVVGGLSPRAASEIATALVDLLKNNSSLELLSQAVVHARRARQMPFRTHFLYIQGTAIAIPNPALVPKVQPPITFVFTGQGPQHLRMGQSLFATFEVFRNTILELDQVYENVTGRSLIKTTGLFDSSLPSSLPAVWSVEHTLPALCMVQIALFDLLASVGVKPDILVGHSAGETTMLYTSGAGSKAMALEVAVARSKAMKMTESLGAGMAALGCGYEEAVKIVARVTEKSNGVLEIGCHNSPEAIVLSGSVQLLQRAIDAAQAEGFFARQVQMLTPSHSSLMDHCYEAYYDGVRKVFDRYPGPHVPAIPCYSTVADHGRFIREFTPEYMWDNIRRPVHFHQAISAMLRDTPDAAFVEISPHPVLSSHVSSVGVLPGAMICPMRRPAKNSPAFIELTAFYSSLGALVTLGINSIDLTTLYGRASRDHAYNIPYPFTRRIFPLRADGPRVAPLVQGGYSLLKMNAKTFPDLAEHVINGEPIVPAAAFIDMGQTPTILQTGARLVWDIEFGKILSLASEVPSDVRLECQGCKWAIKTSQINAITKTYDDRVHSSGSSSQNVTAPLPELDVRQTLAKFPLIDTHDFYDLIERFAAFGPQFQRLKKLRGTAHEGMAVISIPYTPDRASDYVFNPVLLDACFHYALHPAIAQTANNRSIFLPAKLRKFVFYAAPKPGSLVYSHYVLREWTPDARVYNFTVYDDAGSVLVAMTGFELKRNSISSLPGIERRYEVALQPIVTSPILPRCTTHWSRPDRKTTDLIMTIADHGAQLLLRRSLDCGVTVGDDLSRQRYYQFAKDAVTRHLPPLPSSSIVEDIKTKWPIHFRITNRLSHVHHEVFETSTATVQALFSDDILNKFYNRDGFFGPICEAAAKTFDQTITTFVNSGKKVLRVLEVGAGTGLLTRSLCGVLENRNDVVVEYVVSDVSFALANATVKSLPYLRASPKAYDLCRTPEEQGLSPCSFDIVAGLHVIHAAPEVESVLASLHRVLIPGGSLLVVELDGSDWKHTPGSLWTDMVFGGFSEWFGYTDGRDHPSISPSGWERLSRSVGFADFQHSTEIGGGWEFLFTAQKSPAKESSFGVAIPDHHFLTYTFGKEMELQEQIKGFDVDRAISLWIIVSDGIDGDAAQGLVKSLSREYINWAIHLGIFDSETDESSRADWILTYRDCLAYDTIVHFRKDGMACVPRVVLSTPPLPSNKFDPGNSDWRSTSFGLVQSHLPSLKDQQLLVNIRYWSESFSSYRGFSGTIVQSKHSAIKPGQRIVGLTHHQEVSNRLICSAGSVMVLDTEDEADVFTEYALTSAIATLILGPARATGGIPDGPPLKVLLADEEAVTSKLMRFFSIIPSLIQTRTGAANDDERFDLILTGSKELAKRPEIGLWRGPIFVWDDVLREMTSRDSWALGHLIKTSLRLAKVKRSISEPAVISPRTLSRFMVPLPLDQKDAPLFSSSKAYLLVGGMSDLGVHFALWMYQRGAKKIILTSRRGREFLDTDALEVTKLKVAYMERRNDLTLQFEACNATSVPGMRRLMDGVKEPLGGCFLMTLVLSDGLFVSQTEDSIRRVVNVKWDSIKTLDTIVPIQTLDFCVSFSSVSALIGNLGQSNYAMANTIVDGYLARHKNAFSVSVPSISDLGYFARYQGAHESNVKSTMLSPDDLCAYLEDGLLKLYSGVRAPYYIPDMPWNQLHKETGLACDTVHLVTREETADVVGEGGGHGSSVLDKVLSLLDLTTSDFSPEVPFTSYGMDSLAATRISEALRPYIKISQMQLLGGMTWNHLEAKMREAGTATDAPSTADLANPLIKMVEKYSKNFEDHIPSSKPPTEEIVVITGTSGSVGSSVLVDCLKCPDVKHIYALNRPAADPVKAQKAAFAKRGFDPSLVDTPKLTLLNADLATGDLGIGESLLEELRTTVTHIIHAGWLINWSLDLSRFEPLVRGTRNLIDLALSSPLPTPPRIVFISSIAVLRGSTQSGQLCPEEFVGPDLALGDGYSESKWVAERILQLAATQTSLRPIIVRVDQVSGSSNGYWKTTEWLPSLIQSAAIVKCLPDSPSHAGWVPLEVVGPVIAEIRNTSSSIVNITHPKPVSWRFVLGRVAQILGVPIVPFHDWLAQLEALAASSKGNGTTAIALLETYRTVDPSATEIVPRMSNGNALRESPTLATVQPLTEKDIDSWLSYWKSTSFISF